MLYERGIVTSKLKSCVSRQGHTSNSEITDVTSKRRMCYIQEFRNFYTVLEYSFVRSFVNAESDIVGLKFISYSNI